MTRPTPSEASPDEQNEASSDQACHEDFGDEDVCDDEGVSLEELSRTYAEMLGQPAEAQSAEAPSADDRSDSDDIPAQADLSAPEEADDLSVEGQCPVTPQSILEAVLFVGRPDGGAISATEIASLMRGVETSEIQGLVDALNAEYQRSTSALRIVELGSGYKMQLCDDLSFIVDRFHGRMRDFRLNQDSVDCLALVAYQPGISREQLDEQRGRSSGSVLNQLVRRQLLEMRREGEGKQPTRRYFPTDRLLSLTGLASLEDLPQVEEHE